MRITRQTLMKIAQDIVAQRIRADRNLLAVYLTGSLIREDEPVLGGTADIDLVFIHEYEVPTQREFVRLTEDVHLDILHHTRQEYALARELRTHPLLGPVIYGCQIMHDPRHFLDFIQAGVRAHFYREDNVLERARLQADSARQIWFSYQFFDETPGLKDVRQYLNGIADAAGAIASLTNSLLSERRFLSEFFTQANLLEKPGLYSGLLGLIGGTSLSIDDLPHLYSSWEQLYQELQENEASQSRLHSFRFAYYGKGIQSLLESNRPLDALWPLLNTWVDILIHLSDKSFSPIVDLLSLTDLSGEKLLERIPVFDIYLDLISETLDAWARKKGI